MPVMRFLFHLAQKPVQIIIQLVEEIVWQIQQEKRLSGGGFDGIECYLI